MKLKPLRLVALWIFSLLLSVSCSSNRPVVKIAVDKNQKFQQDLEVMSLDLHEKIERLVKKGAIPPVLDTLIGNFVEKQTQTRGDFATFFETELLSHFSKSASSRAASVQFIEPNRVRPLYQELDGARFSPFKLDEGCAHLSCNVAITGSYALINDNLIRVTAKIVDTKRGVSLDSSSIDFDAEGVPSQILAVFPTRLAKSYAQLTEAIGGSGFRESLSLIGIHWKVQYTESQKQQTKEMLIQKIDEVLRALLKDYQTVEEIEEAKKELQFVGGKSFHNNTLGFSYELTVEQIQGMERANAFVAAYEKLLQEGLVVTVSFVAKSDDNEPLQIVCENLTGRQVDLLIGQILLVHDEGTCNTKGAEQVMAWLKQIRIKAVNLPVKATEKGILFDDEVNGSVLITQNELLNVYNKGYWEIPLKGSVYYIGFTRLSEKIRL